MITLGDIFNKPKIEIFPSFNVNEVEQMCRAREVEIKTTIHMAIKAFDKHVKGIQKNREFLSLWQKEKVKSCMTNLSNYMEYLLSELDKKKIEDYCNLVDDDGKKLIPFLPDIVLLMINSYQGAVETDLHWIPDLTLADSIDISIGDFDFNKFEKYLPSRIQQINELSTELKDIDFIKSRLDSISEAIQSYNLNHLKSSSLLLLTTIEGLVRSLGIYLVKRQGLNVNPNDKRKYASLDRFLRKIQWKKDLKIDGITHGLLTGNLSFHKGTETAFVEANLEERLGFLARRFKDNRNVILHGEETHYANILNSFLNFSALKECLLTIKEYQKIYNFSEDLKVD